MLCMSLQVAPENTVVAFELAAELEHVWGFETDVSIRYAFFHKSLYNCMWLTTSDG